MNESLKWSSNSPSETITLGEKLLKSFPDAKVICLKGQLGSGKTHFVKGVGGQLGINPNGIKSPTFITMMEHEGQTKRLYHCDFYRFEGSMRMAPDWWIEIIEQENSIIVVEWPERISSHLPKQRIEIDFTQKEENKRELLIKNYE